MAQIRASTLQYTERLSRDKCYNVLALTQREFKTTFFEKDKVNKSGDKMESQQYFNAVRKYIRYAVSKNCVVDRSYGFAKDQKSGRRYVKGWGLQNLQKKLRNYVAGDLYYDIDMQNAHPSLALYLCIFHDIPCTLLQKYVEDRDTVLAENNLRKEDILVAMYTDENKEKRGNAFYNAFIYELKQIKKPLLKKLYTNFVPEKKKNPLSSALSKALCQLEDKILEEAMEFFGKAAHVPMFDGFYVYKDNMSQQALQTHLKQLNAIMDEDYNGLVKFVQKPTFTDVELVDSTTDEYADAKPRFEEKHFQTIKPYVFWKQFTDAEGMIGYTQLRNQDMQLVCKEYPIVDYRANGDLFETNIFNRWVADPKRRQYECCDFFPYGHVDKCPPHVFNTFDGFLITKEVSENFERVSTKNFHTLIFNLCDEDVAMTEYIIKYIAHMFQYPFYVTEVVIAFKSWTGCGKDTLVRILQRLMGMKHVGITADCQNLFGNFNDIMEDKLCLFVNELESKKGLEYQEMLKDLATTKFNLINKKHDKPYYQRNCARVFVLGNQNNLVNIQQNDRRYTVIKSGFGLVKNTSDPEKSARIGDFWEQLYKDMDSYNWAKSLYDFLMTVDLKNFNPKKPPRTETKEIMRFKNINPLFFFLREIIESKTEDANGTPHFRGFAPREVKGIGLMHLIKFDDVYTMYKQFLDENYKVDYNLKKITLQQLLIDSLDKGNYIHNKKYRVSSQKEAVRFSAFDFDKIEKFMSEFVFRDCEQDDTVYEITEKVQATSLVDAYNGVRKASKIQGLDRL